MPCQSPHQGQRNKERNTVERQEPVKRERRYRGTGGGARPTGEAVEGEVLEAEAEERQRQRSHGCARPHALTIAGAPHDV